MNAQGKIKIWHEVGKFEGQGEGHAVRPGPTFDDLALMKQTLAETQAIGRS